MIINARPYRFEFDPKTTALVVVDMQGDFLLPEGFGALLGNDVALLWEIVPVVQRLLEVCRSAGITIIYTKEGHRPDLSDCPPSKYNRGCGQSRIGDQGPNGRYLVQGEPINEIIPQLRPQPGELVIAKPGKGAFYATNLHQELRVRGITHLLITGVTTEVCVQTTMREANDRGYECLLVEDATASYFPEFKEVTIRMVRSQGGLVGWTTRSEQAIAGLLNEKR